MYGSASHDHLRCIRAAQAIGLTLEDIATLLDFRDGRTANRDFVDERLGKIRTRKQEIEARLADLQRVDYQPVDLEAVTRGALTYLAKFRDVLEEGTLEQRKEFLRGFIAGIEIALDAARGTITFYELPAGSLMMVPGARDELLETLRSSRLDTFGLPVVAWRVAA